MHQSLPVDRSFVVTQQQVVKTAWVDIDAVILGCRDRMAVGDVDAAYRKVLAHGKDIGSWPPPIGYWVGDRFCLIDGRHEHLSRLMLGAEKVFVAWVEDIRGD